jgi:hypothetical protein
VFDEHNNREPLRVSRESTEELKRQASELRSFSVEKPLSSETPAWKAGLYLAVLVLSLSAVVYLLAFPQSRQSLLLAVSDGWQRMQGRQEAAGVFRLPAPPPRTVEPRVVYEGSPSIIIRPADVLAQLSAEEAAAAEDAAPTRSLPPPAPGKSPANSEAFALLLRNSESARRLAGNEIPEYDFKDWRPVSDSPPVFMVSLVASRSSDEELLQFIWQVDTENGQVRALSQQARDLEAATR